MISKVISATKVEKDLNENECLHRARDVHDCTRLYTHISEEDIIET